MNWIARSATLPNRYVVFASPNKAHAFKLARCYRTDAYVHRYDEPLFTLEDVKRKQMEPIHWHEFCNTNITYLLQVGFTEKDFDVKTVTCKKIDLEKTLRAFFNERMGYLLTVNGFGLTFSKKVKNAPSIICLIKENTVEHNNMVAIQDTASEKPEFERSMDGQTEQY